MDTLQKTLDIEEDLADLEDYSDELESHIDDRVDDALDLEDSDDDPETIEAELKRLNAEVDELETMLVLSEGRIEALSRAVEEWEGSEVTFREITGAEARKISAEAQQRADKAGVDYTEDFHQTLMLQHAVVSTPPGCPDADNIGDLPDRLFDLFVARANTLNSVGDFEMGNSSLRERMMERRDENEQTQDSSQR